MVANCQSFLVKALELPNQDSVGGGGRCIAACGVELSVIDAGTREGLGIHISSKKPCQGVTANEGRIPSVVESTLYSRETSL
jgi:hypothetical protein